ncbi:HNH endonuclease signature motif containing protein [Rhodococcoides fascians]|uniref:HNH endonuclease signature motif containing protein n=1 Tax=Rhodococcoides fascians TaxID=1828 RepID=UPI00068BAADA|nr:HNH endonuclease signature motif containing protein [Rhodococcus fascians]
MFDTGGWGVAETPPVDDCIAGFLDVIALNRVHENLARAGTVLAYCDVLEMRLEAAEAAGGDPGETVRGALCDLAVTMTGTRRDASVVHDVAERLHRMPLTALRFVTGSFDWSTVVTITSVLHRATDETISTIEYEVCAAGGRMRPQALRNRIWRLWMKADPDGAAQARETAKSEEVGVRIVRTGPGGISTLIAKITDLESAEADALIVEIVGTVCKDDPRSTGMLRAAGLMALLHGEHSLVCQCDLGDECPVAGAADDLPPRRGHLLQIVVAVETLLGLSAEPATLADGTPIDPEVVRFVAADAKWQAMLTELVDVLKPEQDGPDERGSNDESSNDKSPNDKSPNDESPNDESPKDKRSNDDDPDDDSSDDDDTPDDDGPDDGGPDDDGPDDGGPDVGGPDDVGPGGSGDDGPGGSDNDGPGGPGDDWPGDEGGGSTGGNDPDDGRGPLIKGSNHPAVPLDRDDPETSEDRVGPSPPGFRLLRTVVGIGRVRSAAQLPPMRGACAQGCPPADRILGEESVRDGLVARWLGWIAEQPERARGIFPDGHGGECVPSRAAVTYRPSARVATFVRTAYRTCTFPNCDVPSARYQIDHVVPFDKDDPGRGGWTIVTNLQPVCVFHHQAKTSKAWSAVMLAGGAILWSNYLGLRAVTLPEFSIASPPRRRRRRKKSSHSELSPFEPTRWELEYSSSAPPTLADFRSASSDIARKKLAEKRRVYLDHCRVVHVRIRLDRSRYDPAPF